MKYSNGEYWSWYRERGILTHWWLVWKPVWPFMYIAFDLASLPQGIYLKAMIVDGKIGNICKIHHKGLVKEVMF